MTLKASNYPTVRPSLDLNFAQTKRLDPRITYSRASSGTYFDSTGLLKSAATNEARFDHDPTTGESLGLLVEEARTNLLNYSEDFNDATWIKNFTTVTANAAVAPNGTLTADQILETAATSTFYVSHYGTSTPGTYTASVFAKGDGSGRLLNLTLQQSGTYRQAYFDLTTGAVSDVDAALTASIQKLPNGWFRCSVSGTSTSTSTVFIYTAASAGENSVYVTRAGSASAGIYIWGAQLEAGSFPTSYIPTPAIFTSRSTTATYYDANGTIQTAGINVARDNAYFPDENGVMKPAGLLLEAAGTNLVLYSEQFDQWASSYVSVTANSISAPDGATTADTVTADGSLNSHWIFGIDPTTGPKTWSVYAKSGTNNFIQLLFAGDGVPYANFDLSAGVVGAIGSNSSASIQKLANGWYRCSLSTSSTTATTPYIGIISSATAARGEANTLTTSVYLWGAQTEASPYPTSYIPTTSSTVTRAADVSSSSTVTRSADVAQITGSNFSSWYNQGASTVLMEYTIRNGSANSSSYLELFGFTNNNTFSGNIAGRIDTGSSIRTWSQNNNVGVNLTVTDGVYKSCHGILENTPTNKTISISVNGSAVSSATVSATAVTHNLFEIGSSFGGNSLIDNPISRLTYYPVRLPDATLQTITS